MACVIFLLDNAGLKRIMHDPIFRLTRFLVNYVTMFEMFWVLSFFFYYLWRWNSHTIKLTILKKTIQWNLVYSYIVQRPPLSCSNEFCHPKRKPQNLLSSHPRHPPSFSPSWPLCEKLRNRFGIRRETGELVGGYECGRESVERKYPQIKCRENIQRPEDPALRTFTCIITLGNNWENYQPQ